jgi:hypothetical protein
MPPNDTIILQLYQGDAFLANLERKKNFLISS